ncbi:GreA/GreB family elongation factor [Novosphingobium aromaticivorans DSM 12444]|uniref:Transcription elongation factor GreB n=2 Tax=Novosphingobium aromaticivorans TaxID=48935 RepID=Q2G8D8_NOVAD|nr:GreA/GreB family elongation factor [Novosphingobium aromaticivorans DSM 12444]
MRSLAPDKPCRPFHPRPKALPMKPDGHPITPAGFAALRARYDHLLGTERPAIVEIVSWAAGNGDRSENGDYLYGRKRMREIDRELAFLARRMKASRVVDPARQEDRSRVLFGATVEIADEDDNRKVLTLVGDDEQDASKGLIGWSAPIAKALRGSRVGDLRIVRLPSGQKEWEIMAISYPEA